MKMIIAVIRPDKLDTVKKALAQTDVSLMTVTDVRGAGLQGGRDEVYRGQEYSVELVPRVKLEIAVNEEFVSATVDAIVSSARSTDTGAIGDGKVFVIPLEDCVRIRTGETGPRAIGS